MSSQVDTANNLFDFFHEHVVDAREEVGVPLAGDTTLYLVSLLTERARADREAPREHTLAELHARAAAQPFSRQAPVYRELGDRALYLLGWFRESLSSKIVGPGYYRDMGSAAYHRVDLVFKAAFADAFGPVFRELADRFSECTEIVARVRRAHDDEPDALERLYTEWLADRSPAAARKLRARGLVLVTPPGYDGEV